MDLREVLGCSWFRVMTWMITRMMRSYADISRLFRTQDIPGEHRRGDDAGTKSEFTRRKRERHMLMVEVN